MLFSSENFRPLVRINVQASLLRDGQGRLSALCDCGDDARPPGGFVGLPLQLRDPQRVAVPFRSIPGRVSSRPVLLEPRPFRDLPLLPGAGARRKGAPAGRAGAYEEVGQVGGADPDPASRRVPLVVLPAL